MVRKLHRSAGFAAILCLAAGAAPAQGPGPDQAIRTAPAVPFPAPDPTAPIPIPIAPPNGVAVPMPMPVSPGPPLTVPPGLQTPLPPPPATGPTTMTVRLSGAAALAAIAGNTLTGKIDGEETTLFLANDGRMTMLADSEQTQGRWEMRGRELCILVEGEDDECYDLEVSGNIATLKEDATTSYRLDIVKGNVKNLPLAAPR